MLLTAQGLVQLKNERDQLINMRRPDAVKRMAAARDQGDLSENSEYAAAKEDLAFIDGRIAELEDVIRGAKVISGNHAKGIVEVGAKVTVFIQNQKHEFMIVGEPEANPKEKKISHSSPLGKALLGRKIGDVIEVEAPAGKIQYKILSIE